MASTTIRVRAVLFDSDGVLVDSHPQVVAAWRMICDRYGLDAEELLPSLVGVRAGDTLGRYLDGDRLAAAVAELETEEVRTAADTVAVPGAPEFVASLPRDRYAFVTSAAMALAVARWRGAGIEPPSVVVAADDVSRGKPDPEPFLVGARRLGVDPAQCVVFEDSISGGRAARAAGATVIAVGGIDWPEAPDHRVADLTEVSATVDGDALVVTIA